MFNKKILIAVTLLTSNLLPLTTQVHAENYIDYELCNDLNFGTEEEYPLDLNSNVAMTTKLVKEENDDLAIYLYDPTANFKYDSSRTYKVNLNYCNNKVSVDEWSSYVYATKNLNVKFDGLSSNGTVTKWLVEDFVINNKIDFNSFRSYLINNIYSDDYMYVLKDHFVLSPVDENGNSDLQYTQSNVVTLSDVVTAGWAIDENAISWWDRFITGSREKQMYYFYGFNVSNFTNLEQIYDIKIQYNELTNGTYYQVDNTVNSWKDHFEYSFPSSSKTIVKNLNYKNSEKVIDKGYKHSYEYKTYTFNEIVSVKDMLLANSENTAFTTFMGSKFANCTYVCQFANYDFNITRKNTKQSWVNDNMTDKTANVVVPDIGGGTEISNDTRLANWIFKNVTDTYINYETLFGTSYQVPVTYYSYYQVETTEVKDINLIQMYFKANGIEYDLPVKAQPVPEVPPGNIGEDPGKNDDTTIDWGEIIAIVFICLIAITVLLIILKDLFKLLIESISKFIVWVLKNILKLIGFILNFAISLITYPIRFIFGYKEFFLWKY